MKIPHEKFEKHIQWLHELIERNKSVVTWNEKIPDPDNQAKSRQIDVLIRNGNRMTIVECRHRAKPQDVTWIEELYGRKSSLRADSAIAVSSSGFTEGAIKKAAHFGIILRGFETVTEKEVLEWGAAIGTAITYHQFRNGLLTITIPAQEKHLFDPGRLSADEKFKTNLFLLCQEASKKLDGEAKSGQEFSVDMGAATDDLIVNGCHVLRIELSASVKVVRQVLKVPSVKVYGPPVEIFGETKTYVQADGVSTVAQHGDQVSVIVDLSGIRLPKNRLIRDAVVDMGKIVNGKIQTVEPTSIEVPVEGFNLRARFVQAPTT